MEIELTLWNANRDRKKFDTDRIVDAYPAPIEGTTLILKDQQLPVIVCEDYSTIEGMRREAARENSDVSVCER